MITISTVLGAELRFRTSARNLKTYVSNSISNEETVVIDFSGVAFATRCFIDEFYGIFLDGDAEIKAEIINVADDIQALFDAVKKTHNKIASKNTFTNKSVEVKTFSSIEEFETYFRVD